MRTTELFAAQTDRGFRHFYSSVELVRMCLDRDTKIPVVPVSVVEDPSGTHFAWWGHGRGYFSMVYPSRMLVEMCSPDAFKRAEVLGEGKLLQVRVNSAELQAQVGLVFFCPGRKTPYWVSTPAWPSAG